MVTTVMSEENRPYSVCSTAAHTAVARHTGQHGGPGAGQRREGRRNRGSRPSLIHKPRNTRRNCPVAPLKKDPGPPAKMRKSCGPADLLGQTHGETLTAVAEEERRLCQEVTPLVKT